MKYKHLISRVLICAMTLSLFSTSVMAEENTTVPTESLSVPFEMDESANTTMNEDTEADGSVSDTEMTPEEVQEESQEEISEEIHEELPDAVEENSEAEEESTVTSEDEVEVEEEVFDAATEYVSGSYTYTLSGSNATIVAYNGTASSITIPATLNGYKVVAIGNAAFKENQSLTSVSISEGITRVGSAAFMNCYYLTSVTLPSTITEIGYSGNTNTSSDNYYGPFQGDARLTTVTLKSGSSNAYIGNRAFEGCTSLGAISIPGNYQTIYMKAFYQNTSLKSVYWSSSVSGTATHSLGENVFSDCSSLTTVSLYSVRTIGTAAFKNDIALTNLTIGEGLVSLGAAAFMNCTYLTSVSLPSSLTNLGYQGTTTTTSDSYSGAFQGDIRLTNVTIKAGSSPAYIGNRTFVGCDSLKTISIPGNYNTIYGRAFNQLPALTSVTWASATSVNQRICEYAFAACPALTTVTLNSVKTIDLGAFLTDTNLTNLTLNEGIESIGASAFKDCTQLTTVILPSTLTSLGYRGTTTTSSDSYSGVFQGDIRLSSVTIKAGTSLAYIGNRTFVGCNSLKTVSIPGNYDTIYGRAFDQLPALTTVTWASSLTNAANQRICEYAFAACPALTTVKLNSVKTIDLGAFISDSALSNITLNEGIESIAPAVFKDCTTLTSIVLPSTLTSLGYRGTTTTSSDSYSGVFQGDIHLANVTLKAGNAASYLGNRTFVGCDSLKTITIPGNYHTIYGRAFDQLPALATVTWLTTSEITPNHQIAEYAFAACPALTTVKLNSVKTVGLGAFKDDTALTSITLNEGIESIGAAAFMNCSNLTSVILPSTIVSVGYQGSTTTTSDSYNGAFQNCLKLNKVYLKFSTSDFVFYIGNRTFSGCSALKEVYFYANAPKFYSYIFKGVTATAYYPSGNSTWTSDVKQNYDGNITWRSWTPVAPQEAKWITTSTGKKWYRHADGSYTKNAWEKIDGNWYHFDASGYMQTGWLKINTTWYYLGTDGIMKTGWVKVGSVWYYLKSNGAMAVSQEVGNYYVKANGEMAVNEWIGSKYYGANGAWDQSKVKETAKWITTSSGKKWYRHADGSYTKNGWEKIGGKWYHFDAYGYMQTGWLKINTTWYYLGTDGIMKTGWVKIGSAWYFFYDTGAMATGWVQSGSNWYYMKDTGAMVTGTYIINGKTYKFSSSGALLS